MSNGYKSQISIVNDHSYIREVITHPDVWPWVSDDFSVSPDDFHPIEENVYLKVHDNGDKGLFLISHVNSICCEIHTALLPSSRGMALFYAKDVLLWIGENTPYRKIITFVPENNIKAKSLALKSGFEVEGFINNSWAKNGKLLGQYIMGVFLCQPQQLLQHLQ